jgi:hypothetical protein
VVGAAVADEPEPLAHVGGQRRVIGEGPQVTPEAAVLGVKIEQGLAFGRRSFDLCPVPDDPRVVGQAVDLRRGQRGDPARVEAMKGVPDAAPLRLHDLPIEPPWKTARLRASK